MEMDVVKSLDLILFILRVCVFLLNSLWIAPFISLEHARHPCVLHTYSNDVYIDNDTYINTNNYGIEY